MLFTGQAYVILSEGRRTFQLRGRLYASETKIRGAATMARRASNTGAHVEWGQFREYC